MQRRLCCQETPRSLGGRWMDPHGPPGLCRSRTSQQAVLKPDLGSLDSSLGHGVLDYGLEGAAVERRHGLGTRALSAPLSSHRGWVCEGLGWPWACQVRARPLRDSPCHPGHTRPDRSARLPSGKESL